MGARNGRVEVLTEKFETARHRTLAPPTFDGGWQSRQYGAMDGARCWVQN
jgi:hypothetical protein